MKHLSNTSKYDILMIVFIGIAFLAVVAIWIWFGYRNQELENELYQVK